MRAYVDTSIINGLYAQDIRIKEITKDFFRAVTLGRFTLYGSEIVAAESWNFDHIVKHKTRVEVNLIHKKINLAEIDICSPEEV